MTEKRFTMGYKVYRDNLTGERYDEVTESYKICELLNVLHEENQKLKKENAELEKFRYSIFKRMGELYEEQ